MNVCCTLSLAGAEGSEGTVAQAACPPEGVVWGQECLVAAASPDPRAWWKPW